MAHEKGFVGGDVLDAHHAILLQYLDAIHQQHRITVRKNLADGLDVQSWHVRSRYYSKRGFVPSLRARKTKRNDFVYSLAGGVRVPERSTRTPFRAEVYPDGERRRARTGPARRAHAMRVRAAGPK